MNVDLRIADETEGAARSALDLAAHRRQRGPGHPRAERREAVRRPRRQLQLLGMALGGGAPASGSGSGGAGPANLRKYSRCVTEAGGNAAATRKCADLLTP